MKFYKLIILILIVFSKTGNLLSENNLFSVNNIKLEKKEKTTNKELADLAIQKGFNQLISKILLQDDYEKLSDLKFSSIKQLVTYYQISKVLEKGQEQDLVNFNVTFDKDKIHNLFYNKGILYSEILDKEIFILPIFIRDNEIFVFNNNFFYKNWKEIYENDLIEFILLLENIEIIHQINRNTDTLISLKLENLFKEYLNKNIALIIIEEKENKEKKAYIKAKIQEKKISKSLSFNDQKSDQDILYKKIIIELKKELINLIKSENLIDIRTPSFLNVKLDLDKRGNLVDLNLRLQNIDLIENVFVQEFNKDTMRLRIKYLGKLEKIINQLKKTNINLQFINEQWVIKTL